MNKCDRANEKTRDESTDERAENEASSRRQRRPLRSDEGSNFRTKDESKTDVESEMKEKIKSKQIRAHSWLGTRKIHSSTGFPNRLQPTGFPCRGYVLSLGLPTFALSNELTACSLTGTNVLYVHTQCTGAVQLSTETL